MTGYEADDREARTAPVVEVHGRTLVFDQVRGRAVLWLEGHVFLPIGATVELGNGSANAEVVGVRLLRAERVDVAQVCLDVRVPERYWVTGTEDETIAEE